MKKPKMQKTNKDIILEEYVEAIYMASSMTQKEIDEIVQTMTAEQKDLLLRTLAYKKKQGQIITDTKPQWCAICTIIFHNLPKNANNKNTIHEGSNASGLHGEKKKAKINNRPSKNYFQQ